MKRKPGDPIAIDALLIRHGTGGVSAQISPYSLDSLKVIELRQ